MAASHLESWKLANFVDGTVTPDAEDFRRKVQIAVVRIAKQVAGEPQGNFTGKQWIKRAALAANILGVQFINGQEKIGPEVWLDPFANAVADNIVIIPTSTDDDIEFTITSVFDDLAGVTGMDL